MLGTVTQAHRTEPRLTVISSTRQTGLTVRVGFDLHWRHELHLDPEATGRLALTSSYRGRTVEVVTTHLKLALGRRDWSIRLVSDMREPPETPNA